MKKINVYDEMDAVQLRGRLWGGAPAVANRLTNREMEAVLDVFEDWGLRNTLSGLVLFDITELNDFFWFETNTIYEILNITEDEFWARPEDWYIDGSLKEISND